ncbi:ABC transporter ATP-binding protein [Sphaerisporangium rufum]|uniref:ABC transporter ATP-binding protein n=1 Tax=Sphaerisporangium rufum TaxID=1381558 RepID=A0A919R200_9ACTN|nr:ABC transporter ATP-binding protein [Sphaerisporangium rufum]GII78212.1 ABC transporter ATP-binding protein [Sphaerisporangium rufum]
MTAGRVVRLPGTPDTPAGGEPVALQTSGLGRRYGSTWALRDCTLAVPAGRVTGLVGPNGAGKTTLMHLVAGLIAPTEGAVRTEGGAAGRNETSFLAQDKPLYEGFTVAETLRLGRVLNRVWDEGPARHRLAELGIPLDRRVGRLSGGQRTQVALTLALARRPRLLVLDEPLADLDPLARHDVMRTLMAAVAEAGLTVLLSSHVVADLEGTCDRLIVVNRGRLQLSGDIDDLLAGHRLLTGPAEEAGALAARVPVIARETAGRQASLLVRGGPPLAGPRWTTRPVSLPDLVLAYLRAPDTTTGPAGPR